ncbi:hypothetical protein DVA67_003580 [Solirubrobacter sp. CPCC 204708]|uniref:Uncharacterized protein n=1 Tax=Solirubrobacter deserti TaxID=2282478 RepID=A0ABT4RNS9_9ACTN|nr:hypothetical protein [Solirubrobacter deserti]MBE2315041.1 hypothetical protein [Solirubrobacter deserti]MDA0139956.1 hypothetical protein [Solirubrobacter deserti]
MRAALSGFLLFALPGLLAVLLLRPSAAEPPAWPVSPSFPPQPEATYWDQPATESLELLREVTVSEAKLAGPALAACELEARGAEKPNVVFRRCATTPLARVDGFASANSRMLSALADAARDDCRQRMMNLGGLTSTLGTTARTTLRGALGFAWDEVLEASRTIRAFAREASKVARERGWKSSCRALPERDRPAADEPVA